MALASLTTALQTAISGLQYNQTALRVASNNIANANTEGYSRKIIAPESRRIIGVEAGAGVQVASITRQVDTYLLGNLWVQKGSLGDVQTRDRFLQLTQDMFGTPGSNNSVSAIIDDLGASMEGAALKPEGVAERINVVNAAIDLAQQLNSMSAEIQKLRKQTDADIATAATTVNTQLAAIADLNARIAADKALNRPTTELEDARDQAIAKVAEQIDFRHYTRNTGEIVMLTPSGRPLADTIAATMSHSPVATMTANVAYPNDGISPILLDGIDVTTEIASGKLAGLIQLRDTELPNLASELDRLAQTIRDEINAIHNDGTGYPPPASLTGTRALIGGTAAAFAGSGTVRVAVVNQDDGTFAAAPLDLDLTSLPSPATVNDVIGAINTGLTGFATASVVNNRLVITADNAGDAIAINESSSQIVNHRSDVLATTALGEAGVFEIRDNTNTLLGTVTVVTTDTASDIQAKIDAVGGVTARVTTESNGGSRIDILADNGLAITFTDTTGTVSANLNISGQTRGFSHYFGLNDFFVGDDAVSLASTLALRADLASSPHLVSRGELSSVAAGSVTADTTVAVSVGDNTVAGRLAAKFTDQVSFAAAGGQPAVGHTFSGYTASIVSRNATLAFNAGEQTTYVETVHQNLETKAGQISGVNIDEELANTLLYQNAYSAAARMMSTLNEILDILGELV